MGMQWRMGVGRAIDVLRRDTVSLFGGRDPAFDLSIFSEDIVIVDARLPSFQLEGLATYQRILSTLHWSIKAATDQSRFEITSVLPPVNNEVYMRWRLHLWPRDVLKDARGFLDNFGAAGAAGAWRDGLGMGMPIVFEGYSRYEFHPWTAEIVKHTIDITNPPMYLTDLIQQYVPSTAWMTPATHGLGVPMRYSSVSPALPLESSAAPAEGLAQGRQSILAGAAAPALASLGAASAPKGGLARTQRRASWLPSIPKSCEDDFECNDGKANYPLQCCELPLIGTFCCEPDQFQGQPGTEMPAYVPLPVPVDEVGPPRRRL